MLFTIQDYNNIKTNFILPETVSAIISSLSMRFGDTISTNEKSKPRISRNSGESWKTMPEFKPTVVIEKSNKNNKINDVRVSLNKLSVKNYNLTSELIIEKLRDIIQTSEEDIALFMTTLIDIISTNKIFSELYSKFYKKITEEFPDVFMNSTESIINKYMVSIDEIRQVDQKLSYDDFCKNNKENDKRKTLASFINNLTNCGLIPLNSLFFMINTLLDNVFIQIKEDNKTIEVDEITENIYILLTQQSSILSEISSEINEKVLKLSLKKAKEDPSISSRAIFKYMDIIEKTESAI
jgi:hypothetical protein